MSDGWKLAPSAGLGKGGVVSPEGQEAAADPANFASAGVIVLVYESETI